MERYVPLKGLVITTGLAFVTCLVVWIFWLGHRLGQSNDNDRAFVTAPAHSAPLWHDLVAFLPCLVALAGLVSAELLFRKARYELWFMTTVLTVGALVVSITVAATHWSWHPPTSYVQRVGQPRSSLTASL